MQLSSARVVAFLACFALAANAYENEHHENWRPRRGVPLYSRAVDPVIKPQIDAAIAATANLPHHFWSGRIPPGEPENSVEFFARDQARRLGGTTLEDTLINVAMPAFTVRDQDSVDTWTYASGAYANASRGVTYVWRAEVRRPDNVFDTLVCPFPSSQFSESLLCLVQEFPFLQANTGVTAVIEIDVTQDGTNQPFTLWPTQPPPPASTLVVS
ncbi:hypothetical protein C8R45DRAFT_850212 [Mycena sanguinolenta]|nr:hypothetical protein C8R45DRAFT_850212 [Mycena sanguinolenta]